jgi:hypothetical protein
MQKLRNLSIVKFLENIWFFKKELWNFRSWDYTYNLRIFARSLEKTVHTIEFKGDEVDESRLKKVEKIKRLIHLIKNIDEFNYITMAENELGEIKEYDVLFSKMDNSDLYYHLNTQSEEDKMHNKKVYARASQIEADEWKEIIMIIQGQDHNEYLKLLEKTSEKDKKKIDLWYKWFDGTGMRNWWD